MSDLNQATDERLIELAQQGQLEAFTHLYERYLAMVYHRVRYVIPVADVEDVTQEVFMTVVRSIHSFKGNSQFSTWLRTVTDRRIADYYRRNKSVQATLPVLAGEIAGHPELVDYNDARIDDKIMLQNALQALPKQHREILLLRFAEELKFNEIAEIQERSLEATKSLFRRALAGLRNALAN